jgi:muramoyltetrapeptide carboxypeptidase
MTVRIGVVAPSNTIPGDLPARLDALLAGIDPARRPSLRFHPQCFETSGHFAGPDDLRAQAFIELANDPDLDVVWFGRGGYGSYRLIDAILPALGPAAMTKTYLGYSDAGALMAALYRARIGRVVHGPMPIDLNRQGGAAAVLRALDFLTGGRQGLEPGLDGPAAAFNITILAHLVGTPHLPDLSGHVLLLEEVAEPIYRIDRCLGQIMTAPALAGIAGIRLGRCSDIAANSPDFGQTEEEVAQYWCRRSGIPYLGRADIGHDLDNRIVPFGESASTKDSA